MWIKFKNGKGEEQGFNFDLVAYWYIGEWGISITFTFAYDSNSPNFINIWKNQDEKLYELMKQYLIEKLEGYRIC